MTRGDESTLTIAVACPVSDDWVAEICGVRSATSSVQTEISHLAGAGASVVMKIDLCQ